MKIYTCVSKHNVGKNNKVVDALSKEAIVDNNEKRNKEI